MHALKRKFTAVLEGQLPGLIHGIRTLRHRWYFYRRFSRFQSVFRGMLFPDRQALTVQSGPFKGMRYLHETVWGSITPKWLGSYEAELHPVLADIMQRGFQTVIDVGCAEGYYAVGLSMVLPGARVYAFDTDFISRAQVRRLAKLNKVAERIHIGRFCQHADVEALASGRTLVVCDIEGHEKEWLDPGQAGSLRRCDILVEVHENSGRSSEVEQLLRQRFASSHRMERVTAAGRESWLQQNRPSLPLGTTDDWLRRAAEEHRVKGRLWLWMQPHIP